MKNLLLFFLWALAMPLFSQSNSAVSVLVGGDYSSRVFYGNDLLEEQIGDSRKTNYRFGFNYEYKLTERTWLKTGARYARVGFVDFTYEDLRWGTQHNGQGGFDTTTTRVDFRRTVDYSFIEIPAVIRFEFLEGKWQPFFEIGIGNNFYLKTILKTTGLFEETSKTKEKDVNKYQLSGVVSAGINYVLSEKYKLFLQPTYRHFITQVNDSFSEIHLINFGIEIGARLHLK